MKFGGAQFGPFDHDATCRVRWHSHDGGWFISVDETLFGMRVHLQATTDPACSPSREVFYCCGTNHVAILLVPRLIMKVLENVPALTPDDPGGLALARIRKLFPIQKRKPLDNDLECWAALFRAAGEEPIELTRLTRSNFMPKEPSHG